MSKNKNYSDLRCECCEPLEQSDEGYINPQTCPYTHVEVDGKVYKRNGIRSEDFIEGFISFESQEKLQEEFKGTSCYECGVIFGNIHHVGCNEEVCPVDGDERFFACHGECDVSYHKEDEFGLSTTIDR